MIKFENVEVVGLDHALVAIFEKGEKNEQF